MSEIGSGIRTSRRKILDFLLKLGIFGWLASVLYPVISYLKPLPQSGASGPIRLTRGETANRITSYNVCYTKLLRKNPPRHKSPSDSPGTAFRSVNGNHDYRLKENLLALTLRRRRSAVAGLRNGEMAAGVTLAVTSSCNCPSFAFSPDRITSYNVCYTKLLRNAGKHSSSDQHNDHEVFELSKEHPRQRAFARLDQFVRAVSSETTRCLRSV